MDGAHWNSPSFRGRHPSPRFRGGEHRNRSPHWNQQRRPSPYHFQPGSPFNPYHQQSPHDSHFYATSTPVQRFRGGGRRPFFRGGGGFNKRQSYGSPYVNS